MKVNNIKINGNMFAYDGCHKIYIIEDESDRLNAIEYGYKIKFIEDLATTWANSCSLKFIYNWKLTKTYVAQFENAKFTRG